MEKKIFSLDPLLAERVTAVAGIIPDKYLSVNISDQVLHYIEHSCMHTTYAISSSKYGTGNAEGSFQTPPGIHRIVEKIGAGVPAGRIFRDRKDTGIDWSENDQDNDNLVLTRILRLEGCEQGINRGPSIDSYERFIYIHGTNNEHCIGTPMSHGCICMKNSDIIELFDTVTEGTLVIIA